MDKKSGWLAPSGSKVLLNGLAQKKCFFKKSHKKPIECVTFG
jgi:hypothetical protein